MHIDKLLCSFIGVVFNVGAQMCCPVNDIFRVLDIRVWFGCPIFGFALVAIVL